MAENRVHSAPYAWASIIGLVLLILGVYGTVRTGVNLFAFSKYPTTGLFTLGPLGYFGPREEDCTLYPPLVEVVPVDDQNFIPPSEADQQRAQQSCLSGVAEARYQARVNDISQSLLILALGVGVLAGRKYLFS